jgi:hypothetical protein
MSAMIKFVAPVELLFQPVENKESAAANREAKPSGPSSICESERRWWQLPVPVASTKFAVIEVFALVLLLVLALAAIVACFAELSRLLDSDALEHLAMKAIIGVA